MDRRTFCTLLPVAAGALANANAASQFQPGRQRLLCDFGWKFITADPPGAEAVAFDDAGWRTVDLPHDWSIEGRIAPGNPTGGGGGFFPSGVGWYRRSFPHASTWAGKRVTVEFEGVYMNATVYLNGKQLAFHPYGYTGFFLDLTPHLRPDEDNVLAVRVDQSKQPNSRWYSGSGIYRHVWMHVTEPVHIAPWGVSITTPEVTEDEAKVSLNARVFNPSEASATVRVVTQIFGLTGASEGLAENMVTVPAGATVETLHEITVAAPALWAPETPALYYAVTRIMDGAKKLDEVTTPFGIRSIEWSAEKGFLLNGKKVLLAGGCVHHDNGPLGAAAFDRAEERRVQIHKTAGFNAIRTAHNPPSPAFLDACDRLGMLILDEAFDCWEKGKNPHDYNVAFKEWWQRDIEAMVLRDRNHPSVVMWSVGNEIPERGEEAGAKMAKTIADYVRKLDPTRPITSALNSVAPDWKATDPFFAALDVAGYNYNLANHADDHERAPARVMVCTESLLEQMFEYWEIATDHPYVVGDFVWTSLDYLGEAGIGRSYLRDPKDTSRELFMGSNGLYPWHGSTCGDMDICGFRKASSHYRNIVWDRGEKLFFGVRMPVADGRELRVTKWGTWPVLPSWTWPGHEGKPMTVEVYSRHSTVRLYLGNTLIEEKPTTRSEQFRATFTVPYSPGVLRVVGLEDDEPMGEMALRTAGEPAQLRLKADREVLRADGQDLVYVTVTVVDRKGVPRLDANPAVVYEVSGHGTLAGLGSGDMMSEEPYQGEARKLFHGRGLVVIRMKRSSGGITLKARSSGLRGASIRVQSQRGATQPELGETLVREVGRRRAASPTRR